MFVEVLLVAGSMACVLWLASKLYLNWSAMTSANRRLKLIALAMVIVASVCLCRKADRARRVAEMRESIRVGIEAAVAKIRKYPDMTDAEKDECEKRVRQRTDKFIEQAVDSK